MSEVSILEYSSDISGAEAPPPIPAGEYPATIESVVQKTSQTSGNEYLSVTLAISPDDFPADFDAESYPDGVKLSYNRLVVEDTARARYGMRKFCEAIGAKMGKQIDPAEWLGLSCSVGIKHDMYEGESRAQIASLKAG